MITEYRAWLQYIRGYESVKNLNTLSNTALTWCKWLNAQGRDLAQADPSTVGRFLARATVTGGRRAPSTRTRERSEIGMLYRFLMETPGRWQVYRDPTLGVKTPKSIRATSPARPKGTLAVAEVDAVLAAARTWPSPHRLRNQVVMAFLAHEGMRPAEICNARMCDLLKGDPHTGQGWELTTKIGRSLPQTRVLHPDGARLLASYLYLHRRGAGRRSPLLISDQAHALTPSAVQRLVKILAARSGIAAAERVTPYWFRRSLLSDARTAGADMDAVSGLAGHSRPDVTRRYLAGAKTTSAVAAWDWREQQRRSAA
jgi:site-specific recombinase XerD